MPVFKMKNIEAFPEKEARATKLGLAIAKRVQLVRELRGIPRDQLEALSGLSSGTVSKLESGKRATLPSVHKLVAIAQALQVDVGWLITGVAPDKKFFPPKI